MIPLLWVTALKVQLRQFELLAQNAGQNLMDCQCVFSLRSAIGQETCANDATGTIGKNTHDYLNFFSLSEKRIVLLLLLMFSKLFETGIDKIGPMLSLVSNVACN
jgi:hypothetical protein